MFNHLFNRLHLAPATAGVPSDPSHVQSHSGEAGKGFSLLHFAKKTDQSSEKETVTVQRRRRTTPGGPTERAEAPKRRDTASGSPPSTPPPPPPRPPSGGGYGGSHGASSGGVRRFRRTRPGLPLLGMIALLFVCGASSLMFLFFSGPRRE